MIIKNLFKQFILLYIDGFKNISKLGIKLWIIIFIKLFIMFAILKLFFFRDFLNNKFENKKEKSEYVFQKLTKAL
ncbi:MAG: DUF4492 domain-containing protein [Bacteroidales bacterium]|nr:DUF4492 domain-containing protein [Bacteroidales bacterium]